MIQKKPDWNRITRLTGGQGFIVPRSVQPGARSGAAAGNRPPTSAVHAGKQLTMTGHSRDVVPVITRPDFGWLARYKATRANAGVGSTRTTHTGDALEAISRNATCQPDSREK
jgi:hypothetical protein